MAISSNKGGPSHFLSLFLSKPATSIPKGSQWAVQFHDLQTRILPSIKLAYRREPGNGRWKTEMAAGSLLTKDYQETKGCLFCQAISIPGDGMTPVAEGNIKMNGFIRGYVGGGRTDFPEMRMSFLDTNISFCDSFLRGWSIATSHFGLIARSGEKNYRTNLTCWKFGIGPNGPFVLQKIQFDGLCCIGVSEEECNYDPPNSYVRREARFIYNSYSIDIDSTEQNTKQ